MIAQAFADAGLMTELQEAGSVIIECQHEGIRHAAEYVASALSRDNPRFDRGRFLKACELRAEA
jgi:hypothetical protein